LVSSWIIVSVWFDVTQRGGIGKDLQENILQATIKAVCCQGLTKGKSNTANSSHLLLGSLKIRAVIVRFDTAEGFASMKHFRISVRLYALVALLANGGEIISPKNRGNVSLRNDSIDAMTL
jgi:hypothetical protein